MKQKTQFQSENILMSVLGHLVLIAIIVFSFSAVIEHAKTVSPNRVEIIELDLKNVVIKGDETKLYNTYAPQEQQEEKTPVKNDETKVIENEKIDTKQQVIDKKESDTLIEEKIEKKPETKPEAKPEEPIKNENLPRKKTVVRVKREVMSLDRTLTVSVVDALRVALTRCWNIDTSRPGLENIRLTAHIKFLPTGVVDRLWFEGETRAQTEPDFAYVLETAREAIKTCSPFSMLPRSEYEKWRDTSVTFYPTSGKVM